MKILIAAVSLALCACTSGPLGGSTRADEPACTAACGAQYERCPQMFNAFPERGAIECPAAQQQCMRACARSAVSAAAPLAPAPSPLPAQNSAGVPAKVGSPPVAAHGESSAAGRASKEARLRELKHFHEEGLITDDVYRERQTAILSEP